VTATQQQGNAGVVIVGAGQAGYQCAESLRQEGYAGPITLIGDEPYTPYQRPPLSKSYLLGEVDKERLQFRSSSYYAEHGIELLRATMVTTLSPQTQTLQLSDDRTLAYDQLVLATGATPRQLTIPGSDVAGRHYLKTLDDVDRIESHLQQAERIVVIGAGFIGMEFAAVARKLGKTVQVLAHAERVMERVLSPQLSDYFQQLHQQQGVEIAYGMDVERIESAADNSYRVHCSDTSHYQADLILVGIGSLPNTELAEAAGIICDNGLLVDENGASSVPHIYAAGDCTRYSHPFAAAALRLESVQNAVDQARAVAAHIAGQPKPYTTVPWFWSDQYDTKLQMVGLAEGCDEQVLRGEVASGRFSIFHYRQGALRAVDSINKPADHMISRKLLAAGVSPNKEQAADSGFALKSLLG